MEAEFFAEHMLLLANKSGTGDIHILPENNHYSIYFRQNGKLIQNFYLDLHEGKKLISYFKYLSNMDMGEHRKPQSGATSFLLSEKEVSLRFSILSNFRTEESLVIRLIEKQAYGENEYSIFFKDHLKKIEKLVNYKSGLILFSGPVDSGKTSIMYHLVKGKLEKENLQVITVEDPVEINEPLFLQTQVNRRIGITYEVLLKQCLRHHPDIIIIGEIRDEETANIAVRAALTGHLVLASVHAKNTAGVITRMMELGVSENLLRQTLTGIVFQKLVPRYCELCKEECQVICNHIPLFNKRAILFEVQTGKKLNNSFKKVGSEDKITAPIHSQFNQILRKAYVYGYISEDTYTKYAIP
ncbi:competence type IV pilus ATPase ComGA [Lacticigenium naphthae]|uniref:competence type IV pilus ATPase ComGA n=1 Tax=Lacticigenium naphthae TaxID=515351 RepID=UPI000411492C|nr:competence type IV pilus ATPase ComGA [Lacticigenium naphthae]